MKFSIDNKNVSFRETHRRRSFRLKIFRWNENVGHTSSEDSFYIIRLEAKLMNDSTVLAISYYLYAKSLCEIKFSRSDTMITAVQLFLQTLNIYFQWTWMKTLITFNKLIQTYEI